MLLPEQAPLLVHQHKGMCDRTLHRYSILIRTNRSPMPGQGPSPGNGGSGKDHNWSRATAPPKRAYDSVGATSQQPPAAVPTGQAPSVPAKAVSKGAPPPKSNAGSITPSSASSGSTEKKAQLRGAKATLHRPPPTRRPKSKL